MNNRSQLDQYFRRNVVGVSAVELFWGLGLPVVLESTFLQLFLKSIGASSFAVGLIPFFFFIGMSVFALLASYYTEHMSLKRAAVMLLHIVSGVMLILIGLSLLILGQSPSFLVFFFACYGIFSIFIGMTIPVWLNFLMKIFSDDRSAAGLAYMTITTHVGKLICSVYLLRIVDKYAFSITSSACIFIAVGLLFSLGALFFLMTKELSPAEASANEQPTGFWRYVRESVEHVWCNRNFLVFLAGDIDIYVVITIISFYAHYATAFGGISAAVAAGAFVGFVYLGAIFANLLLGPLGLLGLRNKYLFSKLGSLVAIVLLVVYMTHWSFYLASFLLGVARGTRMLVYPLAVKRLSGLADTTRYFAVAPIMTLPVSAMLPLLCGKFLDHFQGLGGDAYRIVFTAGAVVVIMAFVFIVKTDFRPRQLERSWVGGSTAATAFEKSD